jgi:hypothetical protein
LPTRVPGPSPHLDCTGAACTGAVHNGDAACGPSSPHAYPHLQRDCAGSRGMYTQTAWAPHTQRHAQRSPARQA